MPRIQLDSFIAPARSSRNSVFDPNTLVNLYLEEGGVGAKTKWVALSIPGKLLFTGTDSTPTRGFYPSGKGRLFKVVGATLLEVFANGTATARGTLESFEGPVEMSDSEVELGLVDGIGGYTLDLATGTFARITDPNFPNGTKTITYQDGAFFCPVPDTGFFRYSGVQDGRSWNFFDEASAEGLPDPLQNVVSVGGQLCALGTQTSEFFYFTGDGTTPYARVPGSVNNVGCLSPFAVQVVGKSVIFLGASALGSPGVFVTDGYSAKRVSTPAIDADIATWTDQGAATALVYEQAGHAFYEISSITGRKSHALDITTNIWHVRQSRIPVLGTLGRDIAERHAFAFGKNLVTDYRNGNLYELSLDTYDENGDFIIREITGGNLSYRGKRVFVYRLGIEGEMGVGVGDNCTSDADPQIMLQLSYDGGRVFGVERWRPLGKIGEFAKQAQWSNLGQGYNIVPRIRISARVKVAISGAWADIRVQA